MRRRLCVFCVTVCARRTYRARARVFSRVSRVCRVERLVVCAHERFFELVRLSISPHSQDRRKVFSTKTRDKQGYKPRGPRQVRAMHPMRHAAVCGVSRVPCGHASDTQAPQLRGGRLDPLRWWRAVGCGGAWSGSGRRPCVGRRHKSSSASGSSASP